MYTRSYNIQSRKETPKEYAKTEEKIELSEDKDYNGTVMLSEQENNASSCEKSTESEDNVSECRKKNRRFSFVREPKMCKGCDENETAPSHDETGQGSECGYEEFEAVNDCARKASGPCQIKHAKPCQKPKGAELDRLLIGALILLLMNEKADDVLTMMLGYILL